MEANIIDYNKCIELLSLITIQLIKLISKKTIKNNFKSPTKYQF